MQLLHLGTRSMRRSGMAASATCCDRCGHRSQADPTEYHAIASEQLDPVELMHRTNPRLPLKIESRVLWERRACAGQLPTPERVITLREPVLALDYLLQQRLQIHVPWQVLPIFIGTFVVSLVLLLRVWMSWTGNPGEDDGLVLLLTLGLATVVSAIATPLINGSRDLRNYRLAIEPRLARALRPLRPTLEELSDLRAWAAAAQHPIVRYLDIDRLHSLLRTLPDESLTNADSMGLLALADLMRQEFIDDPGSGEDDEPVFS